MQQYNIHGAYRLQSQGTSHSASRSNTSSTASEAFESGVSLPHACQGTNTTPPSISYYFYHGNVGYYAFYEQGDGVFCSSDSTTYAVVHSLGSADLNGNTLARDNRGSASSSSGQRRWSIWFNVVGTLWVPYRGVVVRRSLQLCMNYGARCQRHHEQLSLRNALVFVHESARLAAHGASNLQRAGLLYILIEGLMGDLFLLIAKDGAGARVQYVSLCYNLVSILSLLFGMLEATRWIGERSRCLVRRLFFNVETGLLGEILCAGVMHLYLTSLNRSPTLRSSLTPARVASFYVWSLVGHGTIVLGLVGFILSVRAVGALLIARFQFGGLAVLTAPNCVDLALRGRVKSSMLRGFEWRDRGWQLFYTREALKAYGVLQVRHRTQGVEDDCSKAKSSSSRISVQSNDADTGGGDAGAEKLLLVHHSVPWFQSRRGVQLVAAGHISGNHVEPCVPIACWGKAVFCDRMLGGASYGKGGDELVAIVLMDELADEIEGESLQEVGCEEPLGCSEERSRLLQYSSGRE